MSVDESQSFGAVLKAAREEKQISVAHISEALKLPIDKIESIEASDISALPPAAFTCGYLRLYSKIVSLNEEDVIRLYNSSIGIGTINSIPGSVSDLPTQASSNDLGMRIVSYSLGLIIIVLFVLWFQNSQTQTNNITSKKEQTNVNSMGFSVAEDELSVDINPELKLEEEVKDNIQISVDTSTVSQIETADKIIPIIDDRQMGVDTDTTVDLQRDKNIALAKEANPIAPSGTDIIDLIAKDDCWVEILDANNNLLYFSLLKKGEKIQLKGQEPFSVFLGKATAVVLALNEIEYDISKYVRNNQIARFTMSMDSLLEKEVKQGVIKNSHQEESSSVVNGL